MWQPPSDETHSHENAGEARGGAALTRSGERTATPDGAFAALTTGKFSSVAALRDTEPRLPPAEKTPPEPQHPLAAVPFEELELLRPVGSGGIAELWLARHLATNEAFVVKLARRELASNPHVAVQFEREWRATRLLTHPGIITHYSRGTSPEDRPFLTMEYVAGRSLSHFVKNPATWRFLRAVMMQLCEILSYVHDRGVLHQDLKPGNIMVDLSKRRVRVTDFGLASFERAPSGSTSDTVLGTPSYMAPEQARGQLGALGPHTEMYTVGVVLYELLSGVKPFSDENDRNVMVQHCKEAPPPLQLRPGIGAPSEIAEVVAKLLAKSPSARFRNAEELRRALAALG